jgi:hypothetical protein
MFPRASVEPAELVAVQRGDHEDEDDDGGDADHGRLRESVVRALPARFHTRKLGFPGSRWIWSLLPPRWRKAGMVV